MCWIQSISLKSNEPPIRRLYIWISLYIQAQSEILDTEHHDTQVEVYHQISMPPEFITKTAVITPFGLFDYLRRLIGYHIAQVCRGLDFVYAYIEDVLFATLNPEEHKLHLQQVFQRLDQYEVTVNPWEVQVFSDIN